MVGPVKQEQEPHIHFRTLWVNSQESYPGISSLGVPPTLQRFFFSFIYVCSTLKQQKHQMLWAPASRATFEARRKPCLLAGEQMTWAQGFSPRLEWSGSKASTTASAASGRNPRCAPWLPRRETRASVLTCPHTVMTALPTDFLSSRCAADDPDVQLFPSVAAQQPNNEQKGVTTPKDSNSVTGPSRGSDPCDPLSNSGRTGLAAVSTSFVDGVLMFSRPALKITVKMR